MRTLCVIPARMGSTRFPGKPLATLLGLELLVHIYKRCKLCSTLDEVIIATCDNEIKRIAEAHGAAVIMTADSHPGCVDRTVEAVSLSKFDLDDDDLILMVQGDEVLVNPEMIEDVVKTYEKTKASVVNLASRILDPEELADPDVVKVVATPDGRALFFSRSAIPSRVRNENGNFLALQQTGVIGFSKKFLYKFGRLDRTPLEEIECIDMLRTLEHCYPIQIVITENETIGVDTPADRDRAEEALRKDSFTKTYMSN